MSDRGIPSHRLDHKGRRIDGWHIDKSDHPVVVMPNGEIHQAIIPTEDKPTDDERGLWIWMRLDDSE